MGIEKKSLKDTKPTEFNDRSVAVLSVCFAQNPVFSDQYFASLAAQSFNDFDIVLLNDGFFDLAKYKQLYPSLRIRELMPVQGDSISKNRQLLINAALQINYDVLVFADFDDVFAENRIEVSLKKLVSADLFVNELMTFNDSLDDSRPVIGSRLDNNACVDFSYVLDKNLFGLSNTALNTASLKGFVCDFPSDILAVDWLFYSILLCRGLRAVYSNETLTYYRQHGQNIAGAPNGKGDLDWLAKTLEIQYRHFGALVSHCGVEGVEQRRRKIDELKSKDPESILEFVMNHQHLTTNPLWWELGI